MKNLGFLLLTVLLVAGCQNVERYRQPQVAASPDKTSMMLAQAADRASSALETLAAIEQTKTPGINTGPVAGAPVELQRGVSINWVGPVENITEMLANKASYSFTILGNQPSQPLVVALDVENKPLIDVLRNVGLQLGNKADIKVDSQRRVVELSYAPNTQGDISSEGL
ncbi:MAG: DotD/TraH family lipoprotein [Alphaproteobacteria bacterium]|nr:DotD/TraH family lipoprotein [Alphaproteobacteria bacterium]